MSIERWSERIVVVELQDDPAFTDDITAVTDEVGGNDPVDVVLNLAGVNYINSSNITKLLKLRKRLLGNQRRLVLCGVGTNVWGVLLTMELDKVFDCVDNVAVALASLQIDAK